MKFIIYIVALLQLLLVLQTHAQRSGSVTWEMEERFGIDINNNSMIDLPNTKAYAYPSTFKVTFKFRHTPPSLQELDGSGNVQNYLTVNWYVDGKRVQTNRSDTYIARMKDEVNYAVKAEFTYENRAFNKKIIYTRTIQARPDDILILAMGDSQASGEGNPDYPRVTFNNNGKKRMRWADDGGHGTMFEHCAAHRATSTWSAQAAIELEQSDPHTSVTYVNVASGGAVLKNLYTKTQWKKEKKHKDHSTYSCGMGLIPQLDKAASIVGDRKIEVLALNIGGNDLGFQQTITALKIMGHFALNYPPRINNDKIRDAIRTGNWDTAAFRGKELRLFDQFDGVDFFNATGLNSIVSEYDKFNTALKQKLPNIADVYIIDYPPMAGDCDEIFQYDAGTISRSEINFAVSELLIPLNNQVKAAAQRYGWNLIETNSFFGNRNAYCKHGEGYEGNLYPGMHVFYDTENGGQPNTSQNVRWVRTASESQRLQHDIFGVLHPNEFGHRAYAEAFLNRYSNYDGNTKLICGEENVVTAHREIMASRNACTSNVPNSGKAIWRSGESIVFRPGFEAREGTNFSAYINPNFPNFNFNLLTGNGIALNFGSEEESDSPLENRASDEVGLTTSSLEIYPNPTHNGNITISVQLPKDAETIIQIMNATGILIHEESQYLSTGKHIIPYHQSNLSEGIYFIQLYADGIQHTQKLIVTN